MGPNYRSILLVILVAHLLAPRLAHADPKLDQARAHFEQGEAYFKAETYDKAIEEYEAAYDLVARPGLLFNIGLCHENAGDLEQALRYFDRFLAADPTAAKAAEARARREALQRKIETDREDAQRVQLAASKRAEGKRALEASNYAEAIAQLTASYELVSEPEVVFELAEAYRQNGDLVLARTDYERYLQLATIGAHRSEASQHIRDIDAQSATAATTVPPAATRPSTRGSLVPAILAFSASGVALTVGALYGLSSASIGDELDEELRLGTPPLDAGDSRFDEGKRDALVADISFAVAGTAAIVGAVLLQRALRQTSVPVGEALVVPTASTHHAGLTLGMQF